MANFAVFDADGVLLDSSLFWNSLGERYIISLGKHPENRLSETLNEMTISEGAEFLRKRYDIPKTSAEIIKEINTLSEKFYLHDVQLKNGARELLEALSSRGVPAVVATAGDPILVKAAFERLNVWRYFNGIADCEKFGAKTEPSVYYAAARIVSAVPKLTVVFEDSLFAVETAKKAGFITAAVADISEKNTYKLKLAADFFAEELTFYSKNLDKIGF